MSKNSKMMNPLYEAADALGLSEAQARNLVQHWYLAGFLNPSRFEPVLREVFGFPQREIRRINRLAARCGVTDDDKAERKIENFRVHSFVHGLLHRPEHAVIAIGLFEYFQQNHFTKGEAKEISKTLDTEYTTRYEKAIQALAGTFELVDEMTLSSDVDATLIIGGKAKTCFTYIRNLLAQTVKTGTVLIFNSDRPLLNDDSDNPKQSSDTLPFDDKGGTRDYHTYLQKAYGFNSPTEGAAIWDAYLRLIKNDPAVSSKFPQVIFFDNSRDANYFYQEALKTLHKGDRVAVSSIQPFVKKYQDQVRLLGDSMGLQLDVHGYGPAGSKAAKNLATAIAMRIDTCYEDAAKQLFEAHGVHALPLARLRMNSRNKVEQPAIDASFSTSLQTLAQPVESIDLKGPMLDLMESLEQHLTIKKTPEMIKLLDDLRGYQRRSKQDQAYALQTIEKLIDALNHPADGARLNALREHAASKQANNNKMLRMTALLVLGVCALLAAIFTPLMAVGILGATLAAPAAYATIAGVTLGAGIISSSSLAFFASHPRKSVTEEAIDAIEKRRAIPAA